MGLFQILFLPRLTTGEARRFGDQTLARLQMAEHLFGHGHQRIVIDGPRGGQDHLLRPVMLGHKARQILAREGC